MMATNNPLRNKRGMALMVTLFALTLLIFIAVEVSYDSNVEYIIASQQVNRLKAYYAAKSGVEVSLLRVLIYRKAIAAFGKDLGSAQSMLDPIWQMPFTWPPLLPDEVSNVDKGIIEAVVQESEMDTQYVTTIQSEGGRIDINDLGSEVKTLREATRIQILRIFASEIENNKNFADQYRYHNFEELVNFMTDWITPGTESLNGGDKRGHYPHTNSEFIPPGQPFKTLEEINMVKGMNEDFFQVLAPKVTVYGIKGINVNYAPKEVLMSLHPTFNEEAADAVIKRRETPAEGGPFASEDDFLTFVQGYGVNRQDIEATKVPFLFGAEYNFRIVSNGQFANSSREITAITYDFDSLKAKYASLLDKQDEENQEDDPSGEPNAEPTADSDNEKDDSPGSEAPIKIPKGRPSVVYWHEN